MTKQCKISFTENWHERHCREDFTAYLKSNGKFRCLAKEGDGYFYDTKARRVDTMPESSTARLTDDSARKYFLRDYERYGMFG